MVTELEDYPEDVLRVITLNGKLEPQPFINKQIMMMTELSGNMTDMQVGLGVYDRVYNTDGKLNWSSSYPVLNAKKVPLNVTYERILEGMMSSSSFEEMLLRYGYGVAVQKKEPEMPSANNSRYRRKVQTPQTFVCFDIPAENLKDLSAEEMRLGIELLLSSEKPHLFQEKLKNVLLAVDKIREKSSGSVPLKRIVRSLDLGIPLDEIVASVNIPDSLFFELYE